MSATTNPSGQPVTVKVDSFPCIRYGYLTGKVASVSRDAARDEKLDLVSPHGSN